MQVLLFPKYIYPIQFWQNKFVCILREIILHRTLWLGGVLSFKAWGGAAATRGQCSQTSRTKQDKRIPWSKIVNRGSRLNLLLEADSSQAEQSSWYVSSLLRWSVQRPRSDKLQSIFTKKEGIFIKAKRLNQAKSYRLCCNKHIIELP